MARVKRGVQAHRRHKKILARAKGYYGACSICDHNFTPPLAVPSSLVMVIPVKPTASSKS